MLWSLLLNKDQRCEWLLSTSNKLSLSSSAQGFKQLETAEHTVSLWGKNWHRHNALHTWLSMSLAFVCTKHFAASYMYVPVGYAASAHVLKFLGISRTLTLVYNIAFCTKIKAKKSIYAYKYRISSLKRRPLIHAGPPIHAGCPHSFTLTNARSPIHAG